MSTPPRRRAWRGGDYFSIPHVFTPHFQTLAVQQMRRL